jgi:hypothetical protein
MTGPAGDDRRSIDQVFGTELPQASGDERDHDRPVTMRSVERTEEEPDYWGEDDREQWLRENVPPHHI